MEMKRTILAVVLSMAVLLLFQNYLAPKKPAPETAPVPTTSSELTSAVPAADAPGGGSAPAPATIRAAAPTVGNPGVQVAKAYLANDVLEVDLSSRAGAITAARLQRYRESTAAASPPVQLLGGATGLDLAGGTRLMQSAPNWGTVYEKVEDSGRQAVFTTTTADGITVRKTYTLEQGRYDLGLDVQVTNGSSVALRDRLSTVMVQDFSGKGDRYAFFGPAYFKGDEYTEVKLKKVKEGVQDSGTISWAAFLAKYFLVALVPDQGQGYELRVSSHLGTDKVVELELDGPVFELEPGASTSFHYRIYMGPKQASVLAPLGANLDRLIDYGFFSIIARPLMWFLTWIYSYLGNYGIAIIILTTVIKLVFWPLSAKSYKSMQRMKELQPKMQRLKERYSDDKERLNKEVMQLYKTHKVNPLGGCLPMAVQIPFFFALYRILLGSIELRHAPFMLWITDLSAADTLFTDLFHLPFTLGPLPLLMGASMFLQQKMTPVSGGNEQQMKMMMYGMPIVFTVMFLNFPSGLVVYWLINNVLSIAQQGMMLRQAKPKTADT